ncbi:DNA-binding HxlR family transcriptional regulator/peroxiredoxin [Actinoplanes octamycinicus]|uniref:DNA-binding HxlR family transcriptional regulator/peroxiredoxin n=1 Tax=Actinoplanes octamycinicus TaxID=135948 RepID=A0A7W7M5H3_9ACTN|nr:winged helix-turn-helix transcriptional regulator [Actinoplanes octamycinicus]MBB4737719.1 DNA-binding HxlR family transcriptional regulator/peroxiredoxin [Actinoplanes octamycinicus]
MRQVDLTDVDCGITQALGVLTDWWTFLIVRDVAGGVTRFDALQKELGMSRRALAERLAALVEHGVLERRRYTDRPPRHDYLLTAKGEGLLPVLLTLQEWGDRYVLGDGSLTATAEEGSAEQRRVRSLLGRALPELTLPRQDGAPARPAEPGAWTVLFCFPGAFAPESQGYPPRWTDIPGTRGCTLEATTYAARHDRFVAAGARIRGVSTQRPDQLAAFASHAALPYDLLSDADGRLAAALRLPTFRAGGADRLKRLTMLVDPAGTIREVQFPVTDPAASVDAMLLAVTDRTPVQVRPERPPRDPRRPTRGAAV